MSTAPMRDDFPVSKPHHNRAEGAKIPSRKNREYSSNNRVRIPTQTDIPSTIPPDVNVNILRSRQSVIDDRIDDLLRRLAETSAPGPSVQDSIGRKIDKPRIGSKQRGFQSIENAAITKIGAPVRETIAAAEYLGMDMADSKKHLSISSRMFSDHRLHEARSQAGVAKRSASNAIASNLPAMTKTFAETMKRLEKTGADLKVARSLLASSKRALRKKEYKDAVTFLAGCKKKMREAELKPALRVLMKAKTAVAAAKQSGIDVGIAAALLNEAKACLMAGNTAEAEVYAKRGMRAAEEPMELKRQAHDLFRVASRSIAVARGLGANIHGARELVTQSQHLLATGNHSLSAECAKKAIALATASTSNHITGLIKLAEKNLKLTRDYEVITVEAEDKLRKAKESLSKNDFGSSLEMAYASLFDSNTAMVEELQKRVTRYDQFASDVENELDSFKQIQDAIAHTKDRSLETIRKYASLSEEIVSQAYENASAYARVSQDIMGQACESTVGLAGDRSSTEGENASARTYSSVLGQVMAISNGDRRLRVIDSFLSGKIGASELDKLLTLVDSNPGKLEIVQP